MNYIYDITLNFNKSNLYEFYEWCEDDCPEFVLKIPAFKVDNETFKSLKNDSKWSVTPRMITMEELTTIMKLEFNSSVSKKYSGLSNDYSWLVPKSTDNTFGYWTATEYASDNTKQWYISLIPEIDVQTKSYGRWGIGFRPVIEISKSNLK